MECIILSHGHLAHSLLDTVNKITGKIEDIICLSNENLSAEALESLLYDTVNSIHGDKDIILFVGIKGGSCWNAAMKTARITAGRSVSRSSDIRGT